MLADQGDNDTGPQAKLMRIVNPQKADQRGPRNFHHHRNEFRLCKPWARRTPRQMGIETLPRTLRMNDPGGAQFCPSPNAIVALTKMRHKAASSGPLPRKNFSMEGHTR